MKTPLLPRYLTLLATCLLTLQARGQSSSSSGGSSGSSGYPSSYYSGGSSGSGGYSTYYYYPSGTNATMIPPSGSVGVRVPPERVGHSFQLKWKETAAGPTCATSLNPMGFIASSPTVMQSFLHVGQIRYPYSSQATPTVVEWWLSDSATGQDSYPHHFAAPNTISSVLDDFWVQAGGVLTRYFAIPYSRFGHGLVAGSPEGGWTTVTQGGRYGTSTFNGSGSPSPLNWFVGSAPVGDGDFRVADRTDGTRAPLNQTDVSNVLWEHDYGIYPLVNVTVYLPPAEVKNAYVLHYQIPGQVAAASSVVWPTRVETALATTAVNATGTQAIAVGSARVSGIIAVGSNFWLTRNIDNYSTPTTPIAVSATLANNSAMPKVWLLSPPAEHVNRTMVTFGIASVRSDQSFTVSQPSSFAATTPASSGARPIFRYEDYALDNTPNPFDYFIVTASVNTNEPFNLIAETPTGFEPFSQAQTWVLDGWTRLGGTPGPLPVGTPGQIAFTINVSGPEPEDGLDLVSPSGGRYPLVLSGSSALTVPDFWHPGETWTTVDRVWTRTLPYTGATGNWWLQSPANFQYWSLPLNVGTTTNYIRNFGYQAAMIPRQLNISLSRWGFDTAPRLRVRQPDGSDFPVYPHSTTQWTSLGADAAVYSDASYSFLALFSVRQGLAFWIYDADTGEESSRYPIDLTTWFALPRPEGLTGSIDQPSHTVHLQWPLGLAKPEGGFQVERKLTGITGVPTWAAIDTLPAAPGTVFNYADPNLVAGKVHTYRVRYFYGSGAARRLSAPSSVIPFNQLWDVDNDGLPDDWERSNGLDSSDPADAGEDSDGDGLTNADEWAAGTNPQNIDTDGDGVPDGTEQAQGTDPKNKDSDGDHAEDSADAYPLDPLRSRDVPLLHYSAIVASQGVTDKPIKGIALGEGAVIAFWWDESATHFGTAVWENGEVATDKKVLYKKIYETSGERWELHPVGISSQGWLAGTAIRVPSGAPNEVPMRAAFVYQPGGGGDIEPALSEKAAGTECKGITPGGIIWGSRMNENMGTLWSGDVRPGTYVSWPYRVPIPITFIGSVHFPADPTVELESPAPNSYRAIVKWGNSGYFVPTVLSYGGVAGAGAYSALTGEDKTTSLPPNGSPSRITLQPPKFKDPSMSFWKGGTNFQPVFSPDPDTVSSVTTVSDTAQGVGTSSRLTSLAPNAPAGAAKLFAGPYQPPHIYKAIPQDVIKQIRILAVGAESSDGNILLDMESLEGPGTGTWVPRPLLLIGGTDPHIAQLPESTTTTEMQINAAKNAGRIKAAKAEILIDPTIEPDDGMAGTVGDMVPSIKGTTGEKHFVSPKKSTEIPEDYVKLRVRGISQELFQKLYDWDGGEEVTGESLKRQVKRDTTGTTQVKIKAKTGEAIADKMNVWVCWATGAPVQNPAPVFSKPMGGTICKYARTSEITFKFTISPNTLFFGFVDYPDLTGPIVPRVPSGEKEHIITNRPNGTPSKWKDGVASQWDVSRQMQITITNPDPPIPRSNFADSEMTPYPRYLTRKSPGPFVGIIEEWPAPTPAGIAGNDDSYLSDEDDNPYKAYSGKTTSLLDHSIGEVTSSDKVSIVGPQAVGLAQNKLFGWKDEFKEFVRLQLGGKWYRVSDWVNWSMELNAKVNNETWLNWGSTFGPQDSP